MYYRKLVTVILCPTKTIQKIDNEFSALTELRKEGNKPERKLTPQTDYRKSANS